MYNRAEFLNLEALCQPQFLTNQTITTTAMLKIKTIQPVSYVAPTCKTLVLRPRNLCVGSPYGNLGNAGGDFDEENTNNYEDELL